MEDSYNSLDELLDKEDKNEGLRKKLKEFKDKYEDTFLVGGVISGLIVIYPILAAGIGAIMGEILDRTLYFNEAIPRAIEALTGSNYFYNNLDKLGAMLGFVGSFFRANCSYKKSDY